MDPDYTMSYMPLEEVLQATSPQQLLRNIGTLEINSESTLYPDHELPDADTCFWQLSKLQNSNFTQKESEEQQKPSKPLPESSGLSEAKLPCHQPTLKDMEDLYSLISSDSQTSSSQQPMHQDLIYMNLDATRKAIRETSLLQPFPSTYYKTIGQSSDTPTYEAPYLFSMSENEHAGSTSTSKRIRKPLSLFVSQTSVSTPKGKYQKRALGRKEEETMIQVYVITNTLS